MTGPSPLPKAVALAAIRRLAESGRISIMRNAQSGMDRLGHDADDVHGILAECHEEECEKYEASHWKQGHWIYVFRVELEDSDCLYVKVSLNVETQESAALLSYKPYGSPE